MYLYDVIRCTNMYKMNIRVVDRRLLYLLSRTALGIDHTNTNQTLSEYNKPEMVQYKTGLVVTAV